MMYMDGTMMVLRVACACIAVSAVGCGTILGNPPEPVTSTTDDGGAEAVADGSVPDSPSNGSDAESHPTSADAGSDGPSSESSVSDGGVPDQWRLLYETASDIAVNNVGDVESVWLLETRLQDSHGNPTTDFPVLRWHDGAALEDTGLTGNRLDANRSGPCVVKNNSNVFAMAGSTFTQLPWGVGGDIAASSTDGADSIWVISTSKISNPGKESNDKTIWRWNGVTTPTTAAFTQVNNAWAVAADLAADGSAWLVLESGEIRHFANNTMTPVPLDGTAVDIGVASGPGPVDGDVYAVGKTTAGVPSLFQYSPTTARFVAIEQLDGVRISVGRSGPFVVLRDHRLITPKSPLKKR